MVDSESINLLSLPQEILEVIAKRAIFSNTDVDDFLTTAYNVALTCRRLYNCYKVKVIIGY